HDISLFGRWWEAYIIREGRIGFRAIGDLSISSVNANEGDSFSSMVSLWNQTGLLISYSSRLRQRICRCR
ncbi:unnamed protein product, partial [Linum tenue]